MLEVVAMPSKYLPVDSWSFLKRDVAGGLFLAHADWLPFRCIIPNRYEESKTDEWIAGHLIQSRAGGAEILRGVDCKKQRSRMIRFVNFTVPEILGKIVKT